MTGFYRQLTDDPIERDKILLHAVERGEVIFDISPVHVGGYTFFVTRDAIRWGMPGNSVRLGMTAVGQAKLLNRLGLMMHCRMSLEATALAALETGGLVGPFVRERLDIKSDIESMSTSAMVRHSDKIDDAIGCHRSAVASWKSRLVAKTQRKGYFRHAGWFWRKGKPGPPAPLHPSEFFESELEMIQNEESAHSAVRFADYSTFVDGISPTMLVNGDERFVKDVFPDILWVPEYLDEGSFLNMDAVRTNPGDSGPAVVAWQEYLIDWFDERDEMALPLYGADGDHGNETEFWSNRHEMMNREPDTLPNISFKQAKSYHPGRLKPINKIVIHTAEILEHNESAERLQQWAASKKIGVSWHYAVDSDSICQSVRDSDTAWATPRANANGIQIEIAGYAAQSDADWNDDYSSKTLYLCARLVASLCVKHGIPAVKLSPLDVREDKSGITGHMDVTRAYSTEGGHMDPGWNFPWKKFLDMVREFMG